MFSENDSRQIASNNLPSGATSRICNGICPYACVEQLRQGQMRESPLRRGSTCLRKSFAAQKWRAAVECAIHRQIIMPVAITRLAQVISPAHPRDSGGSACARRFAATDSLEIISDAEYRAWLLVMIGSSRYSSMCSSAKSISIRRA